MEGQFRFRRRRMLPYCLGMGLALAFAHEKIVWSRQRSSDWYDRIVLITFGDEQWLENFRMRRQTFDKLCSALESDLCPADTAVRESIVVPKQVAITLYWLATCTEYRTVANLFGVGTSTVCKCIHRVCEALVENHMDEYVSFPSGDDLKTVIHGYQESWNFPNCGGAIDGTHIPIIAPMESHGDYLNRKGYYSLIMQAVCDNKYIFRSINIGWPGRVHDARVFANSDVFQKGENSALFPNWMRSINLTNRESSMPVVLLGDAAYPLKPWIMKPYANRTNLTNEQRVFNYRLSRARMTIENSFGRLKGRWRSLLKRLDVDVKFASTVIAACVILHNICEFNHGRYKEEWTEQEPNDRDKIDDDNLSDLNINDLMCAKAIRDDLAEAMSIGNI